MSRQSEDDKRIKEPNQFPEAIAPIYVTSHANDAIKRWHGFSKVA